MCDDHHAIQNSQRRTLTSPQSFSAYLRWISKLSDADLEDELERQLGRRSLAGVDKTHIVDRKINAVRKEMEGRSMRDSGPSPEALEYVNRVRSAAEAAEAARRKSKRLKIRIIGLLSAAIMLSALVVAVVTSGNLP